MAKSKIIKEQNDLENATTMYHSNRITNAFFNKMTIVEMRIFIEILKLLQDEIKSSKDHAKQLELFDDGYIKLKIAFKDVANFRRYSEVVDALENLRQVSVNMQSLEMEDYVEFTGLISKYAIPKQLKEGVSKYFYVKLDKDVATYLIAINQSAKGGIFYTKWLYEVSKLASNIYTVRLYWLVCSWSKKGYFDMSYEVFRKTLGVPNDIYPNFYDFKKRILEVCNKQLIKIADFWLDLNIQFEIKSGKKVVAFKFKILKKIQIQESKEQKKLQIKSIEDMLVRAFHFTGKDIVILHELIKEYNVANDVLIEKIIYIDEYIKANSVKNKAAFALKSLKNAFGEIN